MALAEGTAVVAELKERNLQKTVKALFFDTTATNTGINFDYKLFFNLLSK